MTRRTNARVAGLALLFYIALGITAMVLSGTATKGEGIAEQLAAVARNEPLVRLAAVLNLLCSFAALTLGVTLYGLTREQDRDLSMLGLACRTAEGVIGGVATQMSLGVLWLAGHLGSGGVDRAAALTLGAYSLGTRSSLIAATFFAVGSTCFSWLMLRGRMVPAWLAMLGVIASVLLVVALPLQLGGLLRGAPAQLVWIPMAVFELALAAWLIAKGAAPAAPSAGDP